MVNVCFYSIYKYLFLLVNKNAIYCLFMLVHNALTYNNRYNLWLKKMHKFNVKINIKIRLMNAIELKKNTRLHFILRCLCYSVIIHLSTE